MTKREKNRLWKKASQYVAIEYDAIGLVSELLFHFTPQEVMQLVLMVADQDQDVDEWTIKNEILLSLLSDIQKASPYADTDEIRQKFTSCVNFITQYIKDEIEEEE
jgi:hypothetical protein